MGRLKGSKNKGNGNRVCTICQTVFYTGAKNRTLCSSDCLRIARGNGKKNPWNQQELEILHQYVGSQPIEFIYDKLKELNTNGFVRSTRSIQTKCNRLGLYNRLTENHFSIRYLSTLLGINPFSVRQWINRDGLVYRKRSGKSGQYFISKQALLKLAENKPHVFSIVKPELITWFFEDYPELVQKLLQASKPKNRKRVKIKRLDTGEIYKSRYEAARACHMHKDTLLLAEQRAKEQNSNGFFEALGIPFQRLN